MIMYETKRRKNIHGVDCVAPFINGWNVWDIPEKEWTIRVEEAIKHAYLLGYQHAQSHILSEIQKLRPIKDL